ncbi:MAG: hypothetical protein HC927_08760 [Deltaproteobacteria bacterium]|nr:hypothetical protein [Deltaproteobacteria bacterium]
MSLGGFTADAGGAIEIDFATVRVAAYIGVLEITVVPSPAAGVVGLAGLAMARRRRA